MGDKLRRRNLEKRIAETIGNRNITLVTAESCSGGLIAHRLTNVSGSSGYFLGGVVAYSNEAKINLLSVDPTTLAAYGAVSEEVAEEMAAGARERFGADLAVACTGVAGPSGGSLEKPVGLVYIAVADDKGVAVERCAFKGDREDVKEQTADRALELVLEHLP